MRGLQTQGMRLMTSGLCLTLALGSSAAAQAAPGDHVRVGGAEFTPTVSLLSEWRSNVYLAEVNETSGLNLQVVPGLSLKLDGPSNSLELDGQYRARYYTNTALKNLNDFSEADIGLDLDLGKNSVVGLKLDDSFSVQTQNTEASYSERALTTLLQNNARGALSLSPGGALAIDLGGQFSYQNIFTPQEASLANEDANLNSKTHFGPTFKTKWTFFPKTAFILNYAYSQFDWDKNLVIAKGDNTGVDNIGDWLAVPDGTSHRAWGGLYGRFTERLILNLSGGYARFVYDEASVVDYVGNIGEIGAGSPEVDAESVGFGADATGLPDSLLVVAELEWSPSIASTMTLGYRKDIQDSWFTNYVAFHYGFFRYEGLLAGRVGLQGEFGYRAEKYVGEVAREDQLVQARGGLAIMANSWMQLGLKGHWVRRVSPSSPLAEYDDFGGAFELSFTY